MNAMSPMNILSGVSGIISAFPVAPLLAAAIPYNTLVVAAGVAAGASCSGVTFVVGVAALVLLPARIGMQVARPVVQEQRPLGLGFHGQIITGIPVENLTLSGKKGRFTPYRPRVQQ